MGFMRMQANIADRWRAAVRTLSMGGSALALWTVILSLPFREVSMPVPSSSESPMAACVSPAAQRTLSLSFDLRDPLACLVSSALWGQVSFLL